MNGAIYNIAVTGVTQSQILTEKIWLRWVIYRYEQKLVFSTSKNHRIHLLGVIDPGESDFAVAVVVESIVCT